MAKSIRDASNNDLSELRHLIADLRHQLERYKHVTDYLAQDVEIGIDRAEKQLNKEINKRGFL